jgi:F-type H+-transporting ATPase subunit b
VIKLPPDITFVIQIVAFLIFLQVMKSLLFVPVQRVLHERSQRTLGARQRSEKLQHEIGQVQSEITVKLDQARAEGAQRADEIRRAAERDERQTLEHYHVEAQAVLDRARRETEASIAAVRAPLEADADRLAAAVVAKVLGRAA